MEKKSVTKTAKSRKSTEKKAPAAPKTARRKKTEEVFFQYQGREVSTKDILAKVKDAFVSEGNKKSDIESLEIYIKPEDNAAYYVINGISRKLDL